MDLMDGAMKQQPKKQTLKTFNTKEKPMETYINKNEEPRQSTPQKNRSMRSTEYIYADENGNLCDGVRIHPEFQKLIHPLAKEELSGLENNIRKNGCLDPIKVWQGFIVDGHHRHQICEQHAISFEVLDMDFEDECDVNIWMIDNQLGRRNLTDAARIEYASKKVDLIRGVAQQRQEDSRFQKGNDLNKLDSKTRSFFERKKKKRKILVNAAVGSIAGVGARTVAKYNYVKKHSDEDTLKNLKEGTLVPFGNKGKKKKLSVDGLYRELRAKEKNIAQPKENMIQKSFTVSANRHSNSQASRKDLPTEGISTRIITHPVAELSKYVDPSSIDVIITEPPCKEEDIDLFDHLGDFARHALKVGAPCVVIAGNQFLPDFIEMLHAHLDYCWTLSFSAAQGVYEATGGRIDAGWKPILVFTKGEPNLKPFSDCADSVESIVEAFSYKGETICDPFCNDGSIGKVCLSKERSFVGSDIDIEKTGALKETLRPGKCLSE